MTRRSFSDKCKKLHQSHGYTHAEYVRTPERLVSPIVYVMQTNWLLGCPNILLP